MNEIRTVDVRAVFQYSLQSDHELTVLYRFNKH